MPSWSGLERITIGISALTRSKQWKLYVELEHLGATLLFPNAAQRATLQTYLQKKNERGNAPVFYSSILRDSEFTWTVCFWKFPSKLWFNVQILWVSLPQVCVVGLRFSLVLVGWFFKLQNQDAAVWCKRQKVYFQDIDNIPSYEGGEQTVYFICMQYEPLMLSSHWHTEFTTLLKTRWVLQCFVMQDFFSKSSQELLWLKIHPRGGFCGFPPRSILLRKKNAWEET